jgi:hypothetical protein
MTGTGFYSRWTDMMTRCTNPRRSNWKNYGGRGIKVCKEWHSFEKFMRDMYEGYLAAERKYGKDTTLERVNNSRGYSKINCRWIYRGMQVHNRRKMSSNVSGYIGVSINNTARGGKWRARFMGISLGLFSNPKKASVAYNNAKTIWIQKQVQ